MVDPQVVCLQDLQACLRACLRARLATAARCSALPRLCIHPFTKIAPGERRAAISSRHAAADASLCAESRTSSLAAGAEAAVTALAGWISLAKPTGRCLGAVRGEASCLCRINGAPSWPSSPTSEAQRCAQELKRSRFIPTRCFDQDK